MMKNVLSVLLLFLVSQTTLCQNKMDRNGNLIGVINKEDLQTGKFKAWFSPEFEKYTPKKRVVKKISKYLDGVSVISFAGTWCHDSKRVLPRFYKIMELAGFDLSSNFQLIGITRGKKTPDRLEKGYNIKHTPTLIFYKNGKEMNRFVEHSIETLEKDILKIVSEKEYEHLYKNQ